MEAELHVTLSWVNEEETTATIHNMPIAGATLRRHELRAIASALTEIATDCAQLEAGVVREKAYSLDSLCVAERKVRMSPDGKGDIEIETYQVNGHRVQINQDAILTDGQPTFYVILGSSLVQGPTLFSIQEAREVGNAKAARRKSKT